MSAKPKSREEEIILRVFALIKSSHFHDFKMNTHYMEPIRFPRGLGGEISDFVQAKLPEYYAEEERKFR